MLIEKDMEDAIAKDPERYLGETGLKLISRQHHIGSYVFDLLFEDRHGGRLIVELQRGTLDRVHTYKILDYYDEYKSRHPCEFVDLMVVANQIPAERKQRLTDKGIAFREILMSEFPEPVTLQTQLPSQDERATEDVSRTSHIPPPSKEGRMPSAKYTEFWRGLLDEANKRTELFREVRPSEKHWLERRVRGHSGVSFNFVLLKNKAWVELCIQRSAEESEEIIQHLERQKVEIEDAFGEPLTWDYKSDSKPGRKRTKIMSRGIPLGLNQKEQWGELQKGLIDRMLRLIEALRGRGSLPVNF